MADGQDSTPINVLRDQRDQFKAGFERLLSKDRKRTLTDIGISGESHDSLMTLLADQTDEVWDDAAAVTEAVKSKGFGALIASPQNAGDPPAAEQTPPGLTDAELRQQHLMGNSSAPPSSTPSSLLEQANAALAAGDVKMSMQLKSQHLSQQITPQ